MSDSGTSSNDAHCSTFVDTEDDVDPFIFCSPNYFAFNEGTCDVMVKDLLGDVKVMEKSLKKFTTCAPLMILTWRGMKPQLMLKNEIEIHLKSSLHLRVSYVDNGSP